MTPEPLAFLGAVDLCGILRGKAVPSAALDQRIARGIGISPSLLLSPPFGRDRPGAGPGDLVLVPDPATAAAIPVADAPDITLLLGDLLEVDGAPWECCPRYFLRRALAALHAEFGLALRAGFDHTLIYTGAMGRPGLAHTIEALRRQGGFGGRLLAAMRANRIEPEGFQPAEAPGQYQVAASASPGVAAADRAATLREIARATAAALGHRAILAPFWPEGAANTAAIRWSLHDDLGHPAGYDEAGTHGLSIEAEHMAAGMLHHMPALLAITTPSPASYGRALQPELGAAFRVRPVHATSDEPPASQLHVEFRALDAACNPHLALGALVWAGFDGLRRRRRLSGAARDPAPTSLAAALDAFEESVTVAEWLGPVLRESYLRLKREELESTAGLTQAEIAARYAQVY